MSNSLVFFSSTKFGSEILKKLIQNGEDILGVVTRTDKIRARGKKVEMTEVKKVAIENNLKVFEYDFVTSELKKELENLKPEFFLVVAYGAILKQDVLDIPTISPINIHTSILPILRGASPIESAIKDGLKETGVSFMKMDKGLDTGDIYKTIKTVIEDDETYDSLSKKLLDISLDNISNLLDLIKNGLKPIPQTGESTYAKKILKDDLLIDFNRDALVVKNHINSLSTHIGGYALLNGDRYKLFNARLSNIILEPSKILIDGGKLYVGTKQNALQIDKIQAPGKKILDAKSFILGNRIEGKFNE